MDLSKILQSHELYQRVQSIELLDKLLPAYLQMLSDSAQKAIKDGVEDAFDQGAFVMRMVGRDDLSSIACIYHEKVEIAKYLDFGCSEEEIVNGKAHKKMYDRCHGIAQQLEFDFLQFVIEKRTGHKVPKFKIIPARPFLQVLDDELTGVKSTMGDYLPANTSFGIYRGIEKFQPLYIDPEDFDRIFSTYEEFGSTCSPGFKELVVAKVGDFVNWANRHYSQVEKDANERKIREEKARLDALNQRTVFDDRFSRSSSDSSSNNSKKNKYFFNIFDK